MAIQITTEQMDRRRTDWRIGPVVYQIFVDRFVPPADPAAAAAHFESPRRLRPWGAQPARGEWDPEVLNSTAELEFWGGNLAGVESKIPHFQTLGVDLVYLNPIFEAFTNHKYDASDFTRIDPHYGTDEDLANLTESLHDNGLRIMLDGVFNHMGRRSPVFQSAFQDTNSPYREWFRFGSQYRHGYLGWRNVANLPELQIENPAVRQFLWEAPDSIVRSYLREPGIDGWRLDVAPDLGFQYLGELTRAAHEERPDCAVIGECWNYPESWLEVMDGILNMHARNIVIHLVNHRMTPRSAGAAIERMVIDGGIEGILRSHFVLDNHDTPRLSWLVKDTAAQSLARILQFTLPGAPVIYYGGEVGLDGGHDPLNRGPMRWDLVHDENTVLAQTIALSQLRRDHPALRLGDFRLLEADGLLAFMRYTDNPLETTLVVVNPSKEKVFSLVPIRDSRLMDSGELRCVLSGEKAEVACGSLEATVPPQTAYVYTVPNRERPTGYDLFKRVRPR